MPFPVTEKATSSSVSGARRSKTVQLHAPSRDFSFRLANRASGPAVSLGTSRRRPTWRSTHCRSPAEREGRDGDSDVLRNRLGTDAELLYPSVDAALCIGRTIATGAVMLIGSGLSNRVIGVVRSNARPCFPRAKQGARPNGARSASWRESECAH